jgi:transcriptional regulator with XRE-family HTH domain
VKQKEQYTLEELFNHLAITVTELSDLAGMSEVTIRRIRHGFPARRSTANKLLLAFSKAYDRDLSIDNVTGLVIDERQRTEKPKKTYGLPEVRLAKAIEEKASKRGYNRKQDNILPDGSILASKFAEAHGIARETFRDHMVNGIGPGLIHGPDVPEDGTVLVKDYVRAEERNKRVRKDGTIEKERFLTSDQQKAALDFWRRHGVQFSQCDRPDCPCH